MSRKDGEGADEVATVATRKIRTAGQPNRQNVETVDDDAPRPSRALSAFQALTPQTRVGHFFLEDEIGRGGMGYVYRAKDRELNRLVALKFLALEQIDVMQRSQLARRFRREAQAMAKLSHPNVVSIYEVDEFENRLYLVMEYVEGQNLSAWLRDETLSYSEIISAFLAAGEGLSAAHAEGLIHRDFKPANVLISSDGIVKVTDFGLARLGDTEEETISLTRSAHLDMLEAPLTIAGAKGIGTPPFMSPEQLDGKALDQRSDVYSFGVSLFYALYGCLPYPGQSSDAIRDSIRKGRIAEADSIRGKIPNRVVAALLRSLSPQVENRFASIEEMLKELRPRRRPQLLKWGGIAALGLGLWLSMGKGATGQAPELCTSAGKAVSEVWNPTIAQTLEESTEGKKSDIRTLRRKLDTYAGQLSDSSISVCRATRVDGHQSEALFELRNQCLADRRQRLKKSIELVAGSEEAIAASRWVDALPEVSSCETIDSWEKHQEVPNSPELRAKVEAIRGELTLAYAALASSPTSDYFTKAKDKIGELHLKSLSLPFPPLRTEISVALSQSLLALGQYRLAQQHADAALKQIEIHKLRVPQLQALASLLRLEVLIHDRLYDESEQFSNAALGAVRNASSPLLEARFHTAMGTLFTQRWKPELADRAFASSQAILKEHQLDHSYQAMLLALRRGQSLLARNQYAQCLYALSSALAIATKELGTEHHLVIEMKTTMGFAQYQSASYEAAAASFSQLVKQENSLNPGSSSPWLVHSLIELGKANEALSMLEEHLSQRMERERKSLALNEVLAETEPDDSDEERAEWFVGLAQAYSKLGMHENAIALLQKGFTRAGGRLMRQLGVWDVSVKARPVFSIALAMAQSHVKSGNASEGLEYALLAREIALVRFGNRSNAGGSQKGHTELVLALLQLLEVQEKSGSITQARDTLAQITRSPFPLPPALRAETNFAIARLHWPLRDKPESFTTQKLIEQAEAAREHWKKIGGRALLRAEAANQWLRSHSQ